MRIRKSTPTSGLPFAVDNEIDGQANEFDPDEQFVPGTINLNTVSGDLHALEATRLGHILQSALPIPDEDIRKSAIKAIIKYRDQIGPFSGSNRGLPIMNYRINPGIAHIGELMNCATLNPNESITAMAMDGEDTLALNDGTGDVVVDFLPEPSHEGEDGVGGEGPPPPVAPTPDGIQDDREEAVMVPQWLMQVCSTRSDLFTAYVLIQGYPVEDFSRGAVESSRFFAIFDRSRITNGEDQPRILGVYHLE